MTKTFINKLGFGSIMSNVSTLVSPDLAVINDRERAIQDSIEGRKLPRINIDMILNSYRNAFELREKDDLHVLIDTCSVKRVPLCNAGNPLFDFSHESGQYNLMITERVLDEVVRLLDIYPNDEMRILTDYFLSNVTCALGADVMVPEDNKQMIEHYSMAAQNKHLERKKAAAMRELESYGCFISANIDNFMADPRSVQSHFDNLNKIFEKVNLCSAGIDALNPIGITDTQMVHYAIDRAREDKQTIIITDDWHIRDAVKYLRKSSPEKDIFKRNILAFGLKYVVESLYKDHDLRYAA